MRTCPKCGSRASLLTYKNGSYVEHCIACSDTNCQINTGFNFCELPEVIRRWNIGIGLEHKNGKAYYNYDKPRDLIALRVDV